MNCEALKLTNPRTNEEYSLYKNKILIGSGDNCDLIIKDPSISNYHCMLVISDTGTQILDLKSVNGLMNNNQPINKANLFPGDQLQIGNVILCVSETIVEVIENVDSQIQKMESEFVPILTPVEGMILIDDEYCDIVFDETQYKPVVDSPIANTNFVSSEFIEVESDLEIVDHLQADDQNALYITTLSNGVVLNIENYKLSNNTVKLSSSFNKHTIFAPFIDSSVELDFITIKDGSVYIHENSQFDSNFNDYSQALKLDSKVILNYNTFQIVIELENAPSTHKTLPFMMRDREFLKESGKVFAAIFVPMLLLLFVNFKVDKPKPVTDVAIIYKKKVETKTDTNKMAKSNPDKKETGGLKKNKQDPKKVQFSKKGEQKKSKPTKKIQVAKTKPKKGKKAKVVKAYKFAMATNVKSIFADVGDVSVENNRKVASTNNSLSSISTSNTKISTQVGDIGSMGSDSRGSTSGSFGTKGLSSKSGFDSSYSITKTVVLGSIDPELLRKILREYLPQFRHCYQQELMGNEKVQGIVDLKFRIGAMGRASAIKVLSKKSAFSTSGKGCMAKVLSIIDFPKPKGGGVVDVRQPLNFFSETSKG
jgi:pSer/pThr/pTyr-binding forkhead associated (FHA) protein